MRLVTQLWVVIALVALAACAVQASQEVYTYPWGQQVIDGEHARAHPEMVNIQGPVARNRQDIAELRDDHERLEDKVEGVEQEQRRLARSYSPEVVGGTVVNNYGPVTYTSESNLLVDGGAVGARRGGETPNNVRSSGRRSRTNDMPAPPAGGNTMENLWITIGLLAALAVGVTLALTWNARALDRRERQDRTRGMDEQTEAELRRVEVENRRMDLRQRELELLRQGLVEGEEADYRLNTPNGNRSGRLRPPTPASPAPAPAGGGGAGGGTGGGTTGPSDAAITAARAAFVRTPARWRATPGQREQQVRELAGLLDLLVPDLGVDADVDAVLSANPGI